jgi:hypothetical protein
MKKLYFITAIFIYKIGLSQNPLAHSNYFGVQARLIDLMPFEISYIHVSEKSISFSFRGGYGEGIKNNTTTQVNNWLYPVYTNYGRNFSINQSFRALFIKPGIIFAKTHGYYSNSFYSLNYNIAKSYDELLIENEDQLYGKFTTKYREEHLYQSLELEGNHQLKITKRYAIGMGYLFGYKMVNEVPFQNNIQGVDKSSQYSPSQGIGKIVYVNLLLSIMIKL